MVLYSISTIFIGIVIEHLNCRETTVLYDPTDSSTNVKQGVATVVAHELGHMWFGNLVTMVRIICK